MDKTVGQELDDASWAALQARDTTAGFYAVVTTGIVCRSGCPARTPLRGNVRLVASVAQAVTAGYRPCKRCRPDTQGTSAPCRGQA